MKKFKVVPPPYKIKVVEPIKIISRREREEAIKKAGYNTFLLQSSNIYIDLLTDSGTSAMSDNQWAGMMSGDEAYAGSKNFYNLEKAVRDIYGYKYVVPTHQGRAAEHIMSKLLIKPGDYIPNNMYFTTRRQHQELAGGIWFDVSIEEAHNAANPYPFKGNVDLEKLEKLIKEVGKDKIPFMSLEANVNMAGGQPFSMENLGNLRNLCNKYDIPIMHDATRVVENAYFIQQREKGYQNKSVREIVKEICSYTDGATVSAKKDALVNIGGFLACNDEKLYEEARNMVVVFEGLHTYGGLAGRDMEAMARGIYEMVDDQHIAARVNQIEYLGNQLLEKGVPVVVPIGGHGVFLDAKRFLPHVPQEQYPAQALTAAIYIEGGVRGMERGIVSAGRDPKTGEERKPRLELVRLAVPRRVYTNTQMDIVAEAIINIYKIRKKISGLKIVFEPKFLRFFQARFKTLGSKLIE
ncbi:MAG: tyrosine phenol-lyase [Parcubacteria group bacterium CG08_land_8_20_14_0_20_38_56]|nr:MAG: tyrosine phenol-lyase [Parcubacteria group bacterium CG08_land_8_20_14_0_20_38_56]